MADPAAANDAARDLSAQDDADLKSVMSTAQGRRVVMRIIERLAQRRRSYTGHRESTDFNEGRRSIGIELDDYAFAAAPEFHSLMEREAHDARRASIPRRLNRD